jgi:signal transduction histidine kinase
VQKPNIILTILRQPAARIVAISGALFVAIAWITVIWQIVDDRTVAVEAAVRENRGRVVAFEQYVRRTLEAADLATVYLGQRYGEQLRADGNMPTRQIALPDYLDPVIVGAEMADAAGNIRFSTAGGQAQSVRDRRVFRELRDTPGVGRAISNPTLQPGTGETVLLVARSLRDAQGRFNGVVAVQIPARRFVEFNAGLDYRPSDLISIISLRGMTLARREGGAVSWGQDLKGTLVMERQMADPNGEYWGPSVLDGKRRLFSHQRLASYPIFVTSGVGEADILGPATRRAGWFLSLATALTLVVGALLALYFRHIVNQEQAQSRFNQMRDEFAHSARVSSLSEMAAGLAHELNQPLTAASNYLAVGELMIRGEGTREAVGAQLHQVRGQIARAGDIIRRIRDYLSKGSAELRIETLDATIYDAIELARGGNTSLRARIMYVGGHAQTRVLIDRIQIQQVLVNLIRNAEEAMTGLPQERQVIRIVCEPRSQDMFEIRVDDNGPGFPDSVLEQFNLPFISTKAEHGLGIGLSICRRIIEVHGGELKAWNRAYGATVSFTVKRARPLPSLD